jgi:hypothetical protein
MKSRFLTFALLAAATLLAASSSAPTPAEAAGVGLCGTPRGAAFVGDACGPDQKSVRLAVCRNAVSGKVMARSDRCRRAEVELSLAELAEATGALLPDGALTTPEDEPVAGINKCGQAACLCTGTFCADLIDAGYCTDFHCAPGQCICVF